MAKTVNLKQTIEVNGKPMTVAEVAKLYKNSKDIRLENGKVIIGGRRGIPAYEFSLETLDEDTAFALFSTDIAEVKGLFEEFYKFNTTIGDKSFLIWDLLETRNNNRLIPEMAVQANGEPFLTALERSNNVASLVQNLNVNQASVVLATSYNKENQAVQDGKKPTITSAQLWASLPDAVKYSPEVFSQISAKAGAPLIASVGEYNKYVDKQKMIKAIAKDPSKLNTFIEVFGNRAFYSDTQFIVQLAGALRDKAVTIHDDKKIQEFLKSIDTLQTGSEQYLNEVKQLQAISIVPNGLTKDEYEKYLQSTEQTDKILARYQLTKAERDFVRDSLLKIDITKFAQGVNPDESKRYLQSWLNDLAETKKFNKQKVNVQPEKLLLNKEFMRELFGETLPAAAVYRFYYGVDKVNGRKQVPTDEIEKAINNFAGLLYEKEQQQNKKLQPLQKVNATETIKKFETDHKSINLNFSDSAKLKPSMREKIVKEIEAGKYAGQKGAEKMGKLFNKYGAKICSDRELVTSMLEAIEDNVKNDAFATYDKSKDFDRSIDRSVNNYIKVYEKVCYHYDKHLEQLDKLNISEDKLIKTLEQNPDFASQQAYRQLLKDQGLEK